MECGGNPRRRRSDRSSSTTSRAVGIRAAIAWYVPWREGSSDSVYRDGEVVPLWNAWVVGVIIEKRSDCFNGIDEPYIPTAINTLPEKGRNRTYQFLPHRFPMPNTLPPRKINDHYARPVPL